jgi:hypothetical protein
MTTCRPDSSCPLTTHIYPFLMIVQELKSSANKLNEDTTEQSLGPESPAGNYLPQKSFN